MQETTLLITSEHNGCKIPKEYATLFNGYEALMQTHRAIDFGVASLADVIENSCATPVYKTDTTRLLVDVNRSLWRRTLFSEITKGLNKSEKDSILATYYRPHRTRISESLDKLISSGKNVIHIALHSFTPIMKGEERQADIGLLYDPERKNERQISKEWKKRISKNGANYRVRFNYPYRGKPDGLTAHFRKVYSDKRYLGIELEINQKFVEDGDKFPETLTKMIAQDINWLKQNYNWI